MRVVEYTTTGVDTMGEPYALNRKFSEAQALSIGADLTDEGLTLKDARHLLDRWNAMARAQGNTLVYSFNEKQMELIRQEDLGILNERHLLRQEAENASTRRATTATTIGTGFAALHALQLRLKRIDEMSDEQLLASARRRSQREQESQPEVCERPRAGG